MPSRSSNAATDAMAPPPARGERFRGLALRVVSALVLAPPVLAILYFGPPYSDALLVVAGAILGFEWCRLCGGRRLGRSGLLAIAVLAAAPLLGAFGGFVLAGWWLATGAMATLVLGSLGRRASSPWMAVGVAYLGCAVLAFQLLRLDPLHGREIILWLIAVVWATDIMAFVTGKAIGGPKLAPSVSPNKTWSGLAGGVAAAAVVGALAAHLVEEQWSMLGLALFSATVALAAQAGDLWESSLKRRFGAKDAGQIIPGHGGLLDRVDGLLAATIFVAAIAWMQGV